MVAKTRKYAIQFQMLITKYVNDLNSLFLRICDNDSMNEVSVTEPCDKCVVVEEHKV